jgi:hypothetical protein
MATENLDFGVSVDLENGEEILCKIVNDPKWLFGMTGPNDEGANTVDVIALYDKADSFKDTFISKISLGFAGPKLTFQTHLVFTNKRLILIPYANQKRTKTEMYTTRSLYYNKDIKGACASHTSNDTMYAECINAYFELTPVKGVDLKGLYINLRLKLSREELVAVSASMQRQASNQRRMDKVDNLASQIEYDNFFDAFTTQARVETWKSKVKKANKNSVLGDKSILPMRDFLVWLINNTVTEAK